MESTHSVVWNPQPVAVWNQCTAPALNGIKTEEEGDTRQAVMPYAQKGDSIQFALRIDAIPSPSVLDKKELNRKFDLALFLVTRTGIEPMLQP